MPPFFFSSLFRSPRTWHCVTEYNIIFNVDKITHHICELNKIKRKGKKIVILKNGSTCSMKYNVKKKKKKMVNYNSYYVAQYTFTMCVAERILQKSQMFPSENYLANNFWLIAGSFYVGMMWYYFVKFFRFGWFDSPVLNCIQSTLDGRWKWTTRIELLSIVRNSIDFTPIAVDMALLTW